MCAYYIYLRGCSSFVYISLLTLATAMATDNTTVFIRKKYVPGGTQKTHILSEGNAERGERICKIIKGSVSNFIAPTDFEDLTRDFRKLFPTPNTTYWTGAKYSKEKLAYVWSDGDELSDWIPWEKGHPQNISMLHNVALRAVRRTQLAFVTSETTNRYPFLCQFIQKCTVLTVDNSTNVSGSGSGENEGAERKCVNL